MPMIARQELVYPIRLNCEGSMLNRTDDRAQRKCHHRQPLSGPHEYGYAALDDSNGYLEIPYHNPCRVVEGSRKS